MRMRDMTRMESLAAFFELPGDCNEAGIGLERALHSAADFHGESNLGEAIRGALATMRMGSYLADALAAQGDAFPPFYIQAIHDADDTGRQSDSRSRGRWATPWGWTRPPSCLLRRWRMTGRAHGASLQGTTSAWPPGRWRCWPNSIMRRGWAAPKAGRLAGSDPTGDYDQSRRAALGAGSDVAMEDLVAGVRKDLLSASRSAASISARTSDSSRSAPMTSLDWAVAATSSGSLPLESLLIRPDEVLSMVQGEHCATTLNPWRKVNTSQGRSNNREQDVHGSPVEPGCQLAQALHRSEIRRRVHDASPNGAAEQRVGPRHE